MPLTFPAKFRPSEPTDVYIPSLGGQAVRLGGKASLYQGGFWKKLDPLRNGVGTLWGRMKQELLR